MIVKPRIIPLIIRFLEALVRRTASNYQQKQLIKEDLAKRKAGYNGELNVDYHLSFLPNKGYLIFHDLRLKLNDYFFQIDSLIITPFYALIIEVKNIAGRLHFDPIFSQLIRTINDIEQGLPDPLSQTRRQRIQLYKWMDAHHISKIPIESLIVISHPSTIIDTPPNNRKVNQVVCHASELVERIAKFDRIHIQKILDERELGKLKRLLLKSHTPQTSILGYHFSKSELITGVQCPSCSSFPMVRKKRKWFCPSCQTYSKDAHVLAINDYFLLFDAKITNKQLREYLHISSADTATRLLTGMNLPFTGSNRGRVYYQKSD